MPLWGTPSVSALPLDESQIARAAADMIGEYGDEALTKADDRVKNLKSEGFDSFAKTWELIREVIKEGVAPCLAKRHYLGIRTALEDKSYGNFIDAIRVLAKFAAAYSHLV